MPDKFLEPFRAPSYFLLLVVMLFGINPCRKFLEFWRKSATWEPEKHRSHLNHSRTWCVLAVDSSSCWILMLHDLSQQFLLQSETGSPADFAGLEHGVSRGEFSHSDESPVNDVTWSPLIKTTVCWVWLPFQSFHQYNSSLSPFICGFQPKKKHSSGRGAHPKLWPPHLCPQPGDKNRLCAQSGCPVQCGRAKLPTIKTKAECMPKTGQSCLDLVL